MSNDMMSNNPIRTGSKNPGKAFHLAGFGLVAALLAGCASKPLQDPASFPQAYNQRHPIIVSEAPTNLDLPVGRDHTHLTPGMKSAIGGFATSYRRSGATGIDIYVPSGSANETAARHIARHSKSLLAQGGVPKNKIHVRTYPHHNSNVNGNVRLSYQSIKAHVPSECGKWPSDIGQQFNNSSYENFGCASQKNLAAIVADPNDLITPRGTGEINAERAANVLDTFESNEAPTLTPTDVSDIF